MTGFPDARVMPYLEFCCLIICDEESKYDGWWAEPYKMGNPWTKAPRWKSMINQARERWPVLKQN